MTERSLQLSPKIKEVTSRAIAKMVGSNRNVNGPMMDLVNIVLVKPEAFKNDDEKKARVRLGMVVLKIASRSSDNHIPELRECIQPSFWESETGQRVHKELKNMFDEIKRSRRSINS